MATTSKRAPRRQVKLATPPGVTIPSSALPPHDPDAGADRPSPVVAGEQDTIMDLLAGFADAASATVKVYRVIKNRPLAYVFECSPESFSMDELRDKYGGGEFRVYIHQDGELIKNVRVMVEPPREQPGAKAGVLESALSEIRDHQARTDKLLEALALRVTAPAPPPPSFGDMLSRLDLPATITAVGAVLNMLRPPPPPPLPAPVDNTSSSIELLLKGVELARELKGDGGGESTLMDIVRDLVKSPMLATAIAAASQPQPTPPPQHRPMPPRLPNGQPAPMVRTPMGAVPQPQQGAQPVEPEPAAAAPTQPGDETAQLVPYIAQLCGLAAQDADPELYAGVILDQLPDEAILPMLEWQPTPVDKLIEIHPPAAAHRAWFEELVKCLSAAFDGEPEGDGNPPADELQSGEAST